MTPETEPDPFGRKIFVGMIGFIGLCILAFGIIQLASGQKMTGIIIMTIALGDFLLIGLLYKKI